MARPINQIQNFRNKVNKVDEALKPIHDITTAQMTAAINALGSIKALLEADSQTIGKALARMRD